MNNTAGDARFTIRPILVFRSKAARPSLKAAHKSAPVLQQFDTAKQYAADLGAEMENFIVIPRTQAHYRPQHDQRLMKAIELARQNSELLVMDDVFRLIDCREVDAAFTDVSTLRNMRAPLFSILHGQFLSKMPSKFVWAQIKDRLREFARRSSSVKAGIEQWRLPEDGPTRKAVEKGVLAKQRIADMRAQELMREIEHIRSTLPVEARSNTAALAKALNEANVPTPSGQGRWQSITVKRVLIRAAAMSKT